MSTIKHSYDPEKSFIAKVIDWSVNNPILIVAAILFIIIFGWQALKKTPLDAIPDLSDTQVIIKTEFSGQSPQIVEDLVTYPLSTAMLGLPKSKTVRGFSMFGSSFIYIIFEEGTDNYWARSRVIEALSKIQNDLPAGVIPQIGPDATGVGWVYQYALIDKSGKNDLSELRSLQDWFLKFELSAVPGVSEVASVGGFVKEYQILLDPDKLRAYNINITKLSKIITGSSKEVGGRVIESGETEYIIRSKGYVDNIENLKNTVVINKNGIPVLLSDIARIIEGPELRRGITELNGEGEAVGGIIIMRSGENALNVIKAVKAKIETLKAGLPEGVEIVTVYDRAPLILGSVKYLWHKLIEEGLAVALVCFVFLLHIRSSLVAIITLPLAVLCAFIIMQKQGITANIMSLGGIAVAIGAMVDAAIVMIENAGRKLSELGDNISADKRRKAILDAAKQVAPGLFFSLLIITVSFLPIFALTGQSAKLFFPLAFTKTYSMAASAILSVTIIPLLMIYLLKGKIKSEEDNIINRKLIALYKPLLNAAIKYKNITIIVAVILLLSSAIPLWRAGSEFMPDLYEGDLLYMPTTLPAVSTTKAKEILAVTNRLIKSVPEVERVFGKAGRANSATDPAPITMIESWIKLKPKDQWRKGLTIKKLIKQLDNTVKLPGLVNSWGYPIKIRIDMVSTGIRTALGIKIAGDDLRQINRLALEVEKAVKPVKGTRSAFADRLQGGKYLTIAPIRKELARYNIDLDSFQQTIATVLGGKKLSESVQGRQRYDIIMRYEERFRESFNDLKEILIPSRDNQYIPLKQVANISFEQGAPMIKSENARLTGWVLVDIVDRDLGGYIKDVKKVIKNKVKLPEGYSITFSGQFEQMQKAKEKLTLAIPTAILIIFILLIIHFGQIDRVLMIMLSLPLAVTGGLWSVYLASYNFSIAVAAGFIALAGIAAETAVIMLIYLDNQLKTDQPKTQKDLLKTIIHGAALRIRPKIMTVSVIIIGLLPVFITEGPGSDIMRRIALPMIGGMVTTTALTLIIIPVIYYLWEGRGLKK